MLKVVHECTVKFQAIKNRKMKSSGGGGESEGKFTVCSLELIV